MIFTIYFLKICGILFIHSIHRCKATRYNYGVRALPDNSRGFATEILQTRVASKVLCSTLCVNNQICNSVSFDVATSECRHFSGLQAIAIEQNGNEPTNGPLYYQFRPTDCSDVYKRTKENGVYTIYPSGDRTLEVFCRMDADHGGWTVFQHRNNGAVDFYNDWQSYKAGFGSLNSEFWLGNDNLHKLTSVAEYTLRVDMEDFEGNTLFVKYKTFSVGPEHDGYRLSVGGYEGNIDDSLKDHQNGMKFSTKDRDNDIYDGVHCAQKYKGGWWYGHCHHSNLNGLYVEGYHSDEGIGVNWIGWKGYHYSLKTTTMMIKRT